MRLRVVTAAMLAAAATATAGEAAIQTPVKSPPDREHGEGQIAFRGKGAEAWHWELVLSERRVARLERRLRRRWEPTVRHQLTLAATAYRVPASTLIRKASCESGFDPYARNPQSAATGLLQFLPSTWRSTPFGAFSIYDPMAQSLAGAWMHQVGRGGEWVCR